MVSAGKAAVERTIVYLIAAVYIIQQLTQLDQLTPLLGSLVFIAIVLLVPKLKGMTLWLTLSFMIVGAGLMLLRGAEAQAWFKAAGINVTVVTLFLFAPLFGIPVRLPEYVEALRRFYEANIRSKTGLFVGTQLLTQIIAVFINVGAIPVVYQMIFVKPLPGMSRLLANSLNRGFAGAVFWSPYFAAMAVVTSSLGLAWSSILPYMIGLSILSLLVSWVVDFRELRHAEAERPTQGPVEKLSGAAFPFGLGLYLAAAIVVILVLEQTVELPMMMLICMTAVVFPLVWCIAKKSMDIYSHGLNNHFTVMFPALQKEITLFLAAGFFSGSIGATGFGASVPEWLAHIPLPVSLSFSVFTIALIAGTSIVGIHPIVPVTILAGGIDPASVHISSMYFAVLLLGGWGLSNPISPATAVNNLLAGLFKKQVIEVAASSYKFAGGMAIALLIYLVFVGFLAL
jgi:hypothetical protein